MDFTEDQTHCLIEVHPGPKLEDCSGIPAYTLP